jgi:hypothetical protein
MTPFDSMLCPTALDAIVPTTPVEEIAASSAAPYLAGGLIVMAIALTALLILRFFRKK